jgi:hypothetical protein
MRAHLTRELAWYITCPYQDEARPPTTRAQATHLGWLPSGSGTQAGPRSRRNTASASRAAQPALPRSCHSSRAGRASVASQRQDLRRGLSRPRPGLTKLLPRSALLGPIRSSTLGGGGRCADEVRARCARPRNPPGARNQPRAASAWSRMAWPLPRTHPGKSAGGEKRARVRAQQCPQAPPWCGGARSVLVGAVVRRLARNHRRVFGGRSGSVGPDLAGKHWVATTWADRRRGGAAFAHGEEEQKDEIARRDPVVMGDAPICGNAEGEQHAGGVRHEPHGVHPDPPALPAHEGGVQKRHRTTNRRERGIGRQESRRPPRRRTECRSSRPRQDEVRDAGSRLRPPTSRR